ncbi:MAG: hypothetical protein DME26_00185, partial [Verrucomicrobia bacterium]
MQKCKLASLLLAGVMALGIQWSAPAALVTVTNLEVWDGTNNPHAADGVSIAGSGTRLDPFIYTIPPEGMLITTNGYIELSASADRDNPYDDYSVWFMFSGGNLQMND